MFGLFKKKRKTSRKKSGKKVSKSVYKKLPSWAKKAVSRARKKR